MSRTLSAIIIFCLLAAASTGAAAVYYAHAAGQAVLRARAQKVFAYDHEHANSLPAHKVRALSVALAFHDDSGAERLLAELEASI